MKRRHLFDNGFPVATRTRLAGSAVLLAVANQSLRLANVRLALSSERIANTIDRVSRARLACLYTRLLSHGPSEQTDRAVAPQAQGEPGERTTGQAAHQP